MAEFVWLDDLGWLPDTAGNDRYWILQGNAGYRGIQ